MISFLCPHCDKPLRVKDEAAGKRVKCPACSKPVTSPAASDLTAAAANSNKPAPVPASRPSAAEERTLPPKASAPSLPSEAPAIPPDVPAAGPRAAGNLSSATVGVGAGRNGSDHPKEHYDFLAPAEQPDELGRLGGFRVLKVLGAGGMGVVFQAEDPRLKRKLAIKAMLPALTASDTAKQRFLREAQTAAAIEHDHIVPILQVGEDRGVPFIAMPFLKGQPLDERLKQEPALSLAEVLRIGREAAKGLAAAHEAGLVHRDVKPANLWLEGAEGRVKILDFGLARAVAEDSGLTQQGAIIGTPSYMAPEQGCGDPVDARCDLFSLGVVLYRLCCGRLPFQGKDIVSTLKAVATQEPAAPRQINPDVPPALSDLVMQLLAKKPEERPQSARMVAEALQEIEGQTAGMTAPPGRKTEKGKGAGTARMEATRTYASHSAKRRPRLPWLVGGGVLALGVVGLLLFFLLRPNDKQGSLGRPEGGSPAAQQAEVLAPTFKNSLGMEFVLVPKGKSWLGGGGGKPGDKEVEIAHDFYLGKYEVTQEEWEKVAGNNPSCFSQAGPGKDAVKDIPEADLKRFPVEIVSWDDAQVFLGLLNAKEKEAGWLYRLPREVEWEYACRGGPLSNQFQSVFDFYLDKPTNQLQADQANFLANDGKGLKRTCKVGSYRPNSLGLYDMHGNVAEWCDDLLDPKDPARGSRRVIRGGRWNFRAEGCQAANRYGFVPGDRFSYLGVRLARVPSGR